MLTVRPNAVNVSQGCSPFDWLFGISSGRPQSRSAVLSVCGFADCTATFRNVSNIFLEAYSRSYGVVRVFSARDLFLYLWLEEPGGLLVLAMRN